MVIIDGAGVGRCVFSISLTWKTAQCFVSWLAHTLGMSYKVTHGTSPSTLFRRRCIARFVQPCGGRLAPYPTFAQPAGAGFGGRTRSAPSRAWPKRGETHRGRRAIL